MAGIHSPGERLVRRSSQSEGGSDTRDFARRVPDVASLIRATRPQSLALPDGQHTPAVGQFAPSKYSTLPKFGNGVCVAATRPKEEGRIAIVTNAGRTAVDADCIGAKGFAGRATVSNAVAHTTGVILAYGKIVWS